MENSNRVVFITGASSGIGKQAAFLFAKQGYNLAITYNQNYQGAEETKDMCLKLGAAGVFVLRLDLTQNENIRQVVDNIIEKYGHVDILINNAAILKTNYLINQNFDDIDKQITTNLAGPIKITKLVLPHLKESLVNIGSTIGLVGKRRASVYSATKFGLRGFTKSIAIERKDLRVCVVNPGLTATRMGGHQGMDAKKVAQIIFNTATGRYKRARMGRDINVHEYVYGERVRDIILLLRFIKRCIHFPINKIKRFVR